MTRDPNHRTLAEARREYLRAQGLPDDAGQSRRWVRTDIGPIPFAIPNTEARKRITLAHDLHHVVTGYGTDLMGEAEVGAFEFGSGVSDRTARRLAIRVFGFVRIWERERLLRAFVRGRRSRNLYGARIGDPLLTRSVDEMRRELGIPEEPPGATSRDLRAFRWLSLKGLAIVWGPGLPILALLWWWLA